MKRVRSSRQLVRIATRFRSQFLVLKYLMLNAYAQAIAGAQTVSSVEVKRKTPFGLAITK